MFDRKESAEKIKLIAEFKAEVTIYVDKITKLENLLIEKREASLAVLESAREIKKERDKLKTMVREQTEADLLINALKGSGIIPKPKEYNALAESQRLMALQQAAAQCNTGLSQGLYGRYI